MAKKSKVSVDDFVFFDEQESQPLNIIAKSIQNESKPLAEREQTVSIASPKALANREQYVSKALAENDAKKESVSIASPKALANREQYVSKALAENDVLGLIGKEKKLLFLIYQKCESSGALETPIVTTEELLNVLDVSSVRLRNLIFRLQEQKAVIKVTRVHLGRSGWRRFSIEKEVFQHIRLHLSSEKPLAEREQTVSIASPKALAYPLADPPCSSSTSLNTNNTTTTEKTPESNLWLSVPEKLRGQIPVNQLRAMLKSGVIDQETLEDSLWGFAHDLENGLVKSKTNNPTAVFIGAIKNGGYISQQYLAQKQAELRDVQDRVAELKKIRSELEASRLLEEFESFKKDFPQQAESLKPMSSYVSNFETGSIGYKLWLDEFKKRHVVLAQPGGQDEIKNEGAL